MFKNYLAYNLALSFHRTCLTFENAPEPVKARLLKSAETLIHHFARGMRSRSPNEEAKALYVTLTCLEDCKAVLDDANLHPTAVLLQYEVLHDRLVQIFNRLSKTASKAEAQLELLA